MSEMVFKIEGMRCTHCKMTVEKAIKSVPGVTSVRVDLIRKEAVVAGSADRILIAKAVHETGFKAAG